jgi:hypothetical protein
MFERRRVIPILFSLLVSALVHAAAQDFPQGPATLKEAEAKGLQRLSMDQLKALFPVTIRYKRHRGGIATKTFKPDGSVEVAGAEKLSGTWRFDEKRGGYCDHVYKKKDPGERCYAVYRAGDGTHYFDYDIADGLQTVVWRRTAGQ